MPSINWMWCQIVRSNPDEKNSVIKSKQSKKCKAIQKNIIGIFLFVKKSQRIVQKYEIIEHEHTDGRED